MIQPDTPDFEQPSFTPEALVPDMIVNSETGITESNWKVNTAKVAGGVAVAAAAVSYGFDLSWLNEAWRVDAGVRELMHGGSATDVGILITKMTVAVEAISSTLVAAGLNVKSGSVDRFRNWLRTKKDEMFEGKEEELPKSNSTMGSLATDAGLALSVGAGMVVAKRHLANENSTVLNDAATIAAGTATIAAVSGTIGYLLAGGLNNTEGTVLETPANWLVDYGLDTRAILTFMGVVYAVKYRKQLPTVLRYAGRQVKEGGQAVRTKAHESRQTVGYKVRRQGQATEILNDSNLTLVF